MKRHMSMVRISAIVCLFCAVSMHVFAGGGKDEAQTEVESSNVLTNIAQGDFKQMDVPLLDGIAYFQASIYDFARIAYVVALGLSVIGICWQAFRLWLGTQQVRKVCTDIIVKLVLFVAVFSIYPKIVNETLNLAINIGMRAGGGMDKVNGAFLQFKEDCEQKVSVAQSVLADIVAGAQPGTAISDTDLEALCAQTAYSQDELRQALESKGVEIVSSDMLEDYSHAWTGGSNSSYAASYGIGANEDGIAKQKQAREWNEKLSAFYDSLGEQRLEQYKDLRSGGDKELSEAVLSLRAMDELLSEVETVERVEAEDGSGSTETLITTYMYDPFVKVNGKQTNILSPGAMIKTSVLISSIIQRQNSIEYDENAGFIEKAVTAVVQSIINFFMLLLMTLGLVFASIFCVIQYIMCIFEYFIVTAVGVIFIPFMLFDGTKSFAAKLVTMFSSFFIKTLVMVLCLFWVYSSFLYMGQFIVADGKLTFMTFAYFIFTCLLGWVVTQNAPQIAVTILNGSPQLSMGEFLHAAGTAAAIGIGAKAAANTVGQGLKSAHRTLQGGVRSGQTIAAAHSGAAAAFNASRQDGNSIAKSFVNYAGFMGSAALQGAKNSAATFFTGQKQKQENIEKVGEGNVWKTGFSVGKGQNGENTTESGARSFADAKNMMKTGGSQWYQDRKNQKDHAKDTAAAAAPKGIDSKRE